VRGVIGLEMHEEICLRMEDEEGWSGLNSRKRSETGGQAWDRRSGYG
jgi:hypothetical protein